ncbi:ABC transporter permease [Paenibacillus cisolokensis]|jgi:ABC-2 type transport system permease protein|uniref:ABC transporter permease n=1 Tax=Paenibacillus cisolokensis TaxID=1658519 RepID=A0ABQ4NF53_9BACL|nr:ABC transporter permease [Paenibacillus cisolokensis]GIQ66801.1 ABC transporter permease [Paenibacillus cisolokensis]
MKMYISVFKLRFYNGLQYRAAALAGVATQFFWGFLIIMVFQAFYSHAEGTQPISLPQLTTYVWLQQAFLAFIMLWFRDNELFQLITSGNIAYELCRPSGIYNFWYAKLLAQRVSSALLRSLPILGIAFFLPRSYRLSLPPDPATLVLFLVTLVIGLFVLVSVSMLIYISVFVTMSPVGSLLIFSVAGEFLSGSIIPIPLMPDWLQDIVRLFPFHLSADFPFRVYSGHIPKEAALAGIVSQLLWLAFLILVGRAAMNRALRRVVVQGG